MNLYRKYFSAPWYNRALTRKLCLFTVALFFSLATVVAYAETFCSSPAAWIVSVQGKVELSRNDAPHWQQAAMGTQLCLGDRVRVRKQSRAALRLNNESLLRLDEKTTITLVEPLKDQSGQSTSLLDLFNGAIHILTRTPKPFKIRTPFVNAGVDGTEFLVRVDQDKTKLVVYEGKVTVRNDQGSLILTDHEAAVARNKQAPQKQTIVHPTEAVQWALYYPAIINDRLDYSAQNVDSVVALIYQAEYSLSLGRVEQAKAALEQVILQDTDNSDAYALKAIIAVVQNDKQAAFDFATQSVVLSQTSATARLALSYVQQAQFEIEAALASVQKAVTLDQKNVLAWARLAELQMSVGYLDKALDAAQQAVKLNPELARTQTVLGFAYLLQIRPQQAQAMFAKAIQLDQADPMPRLGMGLAMIREGELEAGRIELEIAASLDPANSLIRSYLGKAYFEEKRFILSGVQFDLAKQRDPKDPTPWFYHAIQKQTQNRPVEALHDIQKSIELNDNRAVYRSSLLLDQDEAARGSSLARIYETLGFEQRAIMETAKSLSTDPASHSSHRFLSDAYINTPRHEVARVSELLQAQLLQPINVNPVQPHLAVADINVITSTGPSSAGFNEFSPLMERNKPQLVASAVVGSNSTVGNETVLSAVYDRASVSIGQYHFQTDGFRENNDQKHNVYNAFVQYAVTPKFNLQAEIRTRKTEHGDLLLDFDNTNFTKTRRNLEQDTARVGARYSLSPRQDFIVSGIYTDRQEGQVFPIPASTIELPFPPFSQQIPGFNLNSRFKGQGHQLEGQYLFRDKYFSLTAGGGFYQIDTKHQIDCGEGLCPATQANFKDKRENVYLYSNVGYPNNVSTTFGLSYDSFSADNDFSFNRFNPKFGLQWDVTSKLRLRMAWFETVKASILANQTLEPTQVAGFNQMFDDLNGTRARRMGVGLDSYFTRKLYGGLEVSERDLRVPFAKINNGLVLGVLNEKQQERLYRAYLHWLPHVNWAVNGEFQLENFTRNAVMVADNPDKPFDIKTLSAPVGVNYFHPNGLFGKFTLTYVQQDLKRLSVSTFREGSDKFTLLDAAVGYRLPHRRGVISLEGRNLSNENFLFRNFGFQVNEVIAAPRFITTRTFFVRFITNF